MLLLDLDDNIMKTHQSHMVNISVQFGANRTTAENDYLKVLQFERQLANVSLFERVRRLEKKFKDFFISRSRLRKKRVVIWVKCTTR